MFKIDGPVARLGALSNWLIRGVFVLTLSPHLNAGPENISLPDEQSTLDEQSTPDEQVLHVIGSFRDRMSHSNDTGLRKLPATRAFYAGDLFSMSRTGPVRRPDFSSRVDCINNLREVYLTLQRLDSSTVELLNQAISAIRVKIRLTFRRQESEHLIQQARGENISLLIYIYKGRKKVFKQVNFSTNL